MIQTYHQTITLVLSLLLLSFFISGCQVVTHERRIGEYIDDSHITAMVKSALIKNDRYFTRVHVETDNGDVLLSGFVSHRKSMSNAVRIAHSVAGVKSVRNAIVVKHVQ